MQAMKLESESTAAHSLDLQACLATSELDVLACQRLRYEIFAEEMGADLGGLARAARLDEDPLDAHCLHLMVRDVAIGKLVACTRILLDRDVAKAGGFYSQTEFELGNVLQLGGRFMEIGRTCVHPDYRLGAAINCLWTGIAQQIETHQIDYLIGCASIPLNDGGVAAEAIMQRLRDKHLLPEELRVTPHRVLPPTTVQGDSLGVIVPPLLKAYLRLGAYIGGEPCWDPDFGVADVFILLDTQLLPARYRKHFLKQPAQKRASALSWVPQDARLANATTPDCHPYPR